MFPEFQPKQGSESPREFLKHFMSPEGGVNDRSGKWLKDQTVQLSPRYRPAAVYYFELVRFLRRVAATYQYTCDEFHRPIPDDEREAYFHDMAGTYKWVTVGREFPVIASLLGLSISVAGIYRVNAAPYRPLRRWALKEVDSDVARDTDSPHGWGLVDLLPIFLEYVSFPCTPVNFDLNPATNRPLQNGNHFIGRMTPSASRSGSQAAAKSMTSIPTAVPVAASFDGYQAFPPCAPVAAADAGPVPRESASDVALRLSVQLSKQAEVERMKTRAQSRAKAEAESRNRTRRKKSRLAPPLQNSALPFVRSENQDDRFVINLKVRRVSSGYEYMPPTQSDSIDSEMIDHDREEEDDDEQPRRKRCRFIDDEAAGDSDDDFDEREDVNESEEEERPKKRRKLRKS